MSNPTHLDIRARANLRWIVISLALCLGLGPATAPGYSQDTEDLEVTGGKKKHRKRQDRPIQLGTSGSNVLDISGGFCCNGTLGALMEKFGTQYVLSNNHVISRTNIGKTGEAIIQPGFGDQSCPARNPETDTVARLTARKKIRFGANKRNKVDAAIAEVVPGAVRTDGEILKIGIPGNTPAAAFVGMEVQKSGRTTGLTRGMVMATNVTVEVSEYPLDCAGLETKVARFVKQIIIAGLDGQRFLDSGDSGSMVYEDIADCPAPVGLLFAGNESIAVASPASTVLKTVRRLQPRGDARFVGCESSGFETTSSRVPLLRPERVRDAAGVQRQWESRLLAIQGVHAVGIGMSLSGPVEPAIYVFSSYDREAMLERLPKSLADFPIEVIETDELMAY